MDSWDLRSPTQESAANVSAEFGFCKEDIEEDWFKDNLEGRWCRGFALPLDVVVLASQNFLDLQLYFDGKYFYATTDFCNNKPDAAEKLFEDSGGKQTTPAPLPQPTLSSTSSGKEKAGRFAMDFFQYFFPCQQLIQLNGKDIIYYMPVYPNSTNQVFFVTSS